MPDVTRSNVRAVWPWWCAALLWFVLTSLAHLQFSLWLVRRRESPFGVYQLSDFVPWAGALAGAAVLVWLLRQHRQSPAPLRHWLWWVGWATCVAVFDRYLTFSINEIAHYPQYALLAWLLGHALDPGRERHMPGRILFWTTLLGMLDELQQYVWIAPTYGMHLDFNDFLVNLIAAAAGVMLYYGAQPQPQPHHAATAHPAGGLRVSMVESVTTLVLLVGLSLALAQGQFARTPSVPVPPGGIVRTDDGSTRFYIERAPGTLGSWHTGPRHGRYRVLAPLEAAALMLAFASVFSRYRVTQRERKLTASMTGPRPSEMPHEAINRTQ